MVAPRATPCPTGPLAGGVAVCEPQPDSPRSTQTAPLTAAGAPVSDRPFTRTGLLGFVGPVSSPAPGPLPPTATLPPARGRPGRGPGFHVPSAPRGGVRPRGPRPDQRPCLQDDLVFVVGKLDGLMVVGVRRHNADDVVATALAVEPVKFVYRGR